MTDTLSAPLSTSAHPGSAPSASELAYALSLPGSPVDGLGPAIRLMADQLRMGKPSRATSCLAIALWSLRDDDLITLDLVKGKALGFIPKTDLLATATGSGTAPGLEGELLALIAKRPRDVGGVIRDWFGAKEVPDPHHAAETRVLRHASAAGLVDVSTVDAGRGRITGMVLGKTKTVVSPNEAAISAARPDVERVAAGWLRFRDVEADVAQQLLDRVRKALDSKTERDDDGPDID